MEARPLGRTGLVVSALGLGGGRLDELSQLEVDRLLGTALDLGVNLVDTARSYGSSEAKLGRAIGGRRDRWVVSTKIGYGIPGVPDWTPECLRLGVERARAELGVDVLDVVHLHSCPLETLRAPGLVDALLESVDAGRVRAAAYSGEGDAVAFAIESGAFGVVQTSVNVCDQRGVDGAVRAAARGIGVLAKRPLANGPWERSAPPPDDDAAAEYFRRWRAMGLALTGEDALGTAMRFAAFAPGVSAAIAGVRSPAHLATLARAVERGPLPEDVREALAAAFRAHDSGWTGMI